ncbi:hypothetical protein S2M10_31810 [Sphingomonas sp. S2M10]|uniref:DUF4255 domain-containing protein n=1 Tax=Sphingomonas sp. S2M10 TaxID=2705010 RepID=UPI0014577543|nr:DUF4255 domain-containing protein [Sphingomonas sp. S2M10]NLS28172.1 hypothetical protein [Sphingomonas sp. S2M10]
MPDGFAIAALNHAMRTRIQQCINDAADVQQSGQFDIVTRPPDQIGAANPARPTLTIYPWRLTPNTSWMSSRTAAYAASGERRDSALLALDILYVLAVYGQDSSAGDAPFGLALIGLHETPVLTRDRLRAMAAANFPNGSPLPQALRDLAEQPAPITVEPLFQEMEEFSQIWSTFNSGVRTGMFYRVGTLLMESPRRAASAPPVRESRHSVSLLRGPVLQRVLIAGTAAGPFAERAIAWPGDVVRLEGSGLRGAITALAVGAVLVPADPARLRSDRMEITLPADLRPGLVSLQVRQDLPKPPGTLPPPAAGTVAGERSNLLPLAIRPVLRPADSFTIRNRQVTPQGAVGFDVTAHFDVAVGSHQRCELMLNATAAGPDGRFAAFAFSAPQPAPGVPEASVDQRLIPIRGVPQGSYLARVVIDGAESALTEDAGGITGPILAVPA